MQLQTFEVANTIMKVNTYMHLFGSALSLLFNNSKDKWFEEKAKIRERAQKGEESANIELIAMESIEQEQNLLTASVDVFSTELLIYARENNCF